MGAIALVYSVISFLLELWVFILFTGQVYFDIIYKFIFPPEPKNVDDEIILITGSASGLGRQIALQIAAKSKAKLVLWDVDNHENTKLAADLQRNGIKSYPFHVDFSQKLQISEAAAKVREDVGDVTMIINNASVAYPQPFLESCRKPRNIELIFKTNIFAQQYIIGEFLPRMLEKRKGHIVTVASVGSFSSTAYLADYISSQHGIHGLVEALKDEVAKDPMQPDIKFTTAFPYFTKSNLTGYNNSTLVRRYPFTFPMLENSTAARNIVDGILRNKEYVYSPNYFRPLALLGNLLPTKVVRGAKRLFTYEVELDRAYFEAIATAAQSATCQPTQTFLPEKLPNSVAQQVETMNAQLQAPLQPVKSEVILKPQPIKNGSTNGTPKVKANGKQSNTNA